MVPHPKPKTEKKNNIASYSIQKQPCNRVVPIFTVNYLFLSNSKIIHLLDWWFISLLLFWISVLFFCLSFFYFSWFFLSLTITNWWKFNKRSGYVLLWIISMYPLHYEKIIIPSIIPSNEVCVFYLEHRVLIRNRICKQSVNYHTFVGYRMCLCSFVICKYINPCFKSHHSYCLSTQKNTCTCKASNKSIIV